MGGAAVWQVTLDEPHITPGVVGIGDMIRSKIPQHLPAPCQFLIGIRIIRYESAFPGIEILESRIQLTCKKRFFVMQVPCNLTIWILIVCEDNSGKQILPQQFLVGVTPKGECYKFAKNSKSNSEMAGACFSPDGKTLFVNIQGEGLTLAIWGPWQKRTK